MANESDNSGDQYISGVCNIGPAEIRRRRIVMWLGVLLSLVTLASFAQNNSSRMDRISIALPAFVFSIGFVQSRKKFCLAFGFMGAFNFGKVGAITKVLTPEQRAADRKTALTLLGQALVLTALIVAVTVLTA
jgi:multisubunit Na+/H+ antiporter MnhC subunit